MKKNNTKKKLSKRTANVLSQLLEFAVIEIIGIAFCLFSGTGDFLAILLLLHSGFCVSAIIGLFTEIEEVKQILGGCSCNKSEVI